MADTVIPVGGNVQGNITSCKIENQTKTVKKDSPISLFQNTEYITYDVCNKQELAHYNKPEITEFGIITIVLGGVVLLVALISFPFVWAESRW